MCIRDRSPVAEGGDHDCRWMLRIHCDGAVAEGLIGVRGLERCDVRPRVVLWIEFPDRAIGHGIGSRLSAVTEIEGSVERANDVVGTQPDSLVWNRQPSDAGIG